MEENERKVVKSYNNVWHLNRTFYNIGGLTLPMPVSMNFALYFVITEVLMYIFGSFINGTIRYLVIPLGIAWLLDQKLLDGKAPFKFIRSIVSYYYLVLLKGKSISRYRHYKVEYPAYDEIIPFRKHHTEKRAL